MEGVQGSVFASDISSFGLFDYHVLLHAYCLVLAVPPQSEALLSVGKVVILF